jgi:hypothetical protein
LRTWSFHHRTEPPLYIFSIVIVCFNDKKI